MSQWNLLQRRAKAVESRLQHRMDDYSVVAQKINANFMHDEENPLLQNDDEKSLAKDIETDLQELQECITSMREFQQTNSNNGNNSSSRTNDELIKRYAEIYNDFVTEFKNASSSVRRKQESLEIFNSRISSNDGKSLFGSSGGGNSKGNRHNDSNNSDNEDGASTSSYDKLLRERNIISQSMRAVNDVLNQAFETRNVLVNQRGSLMNNNTSISTLTTTTSTTINRLIDGIAYKRSNENTVIAIFIAILICFTIWWIFLR